MQAGRRRRDEFLEADKQIHMTIAATTQQPDLPERPDLHSRQHPPLLRPLPVDGRPRAQGKLPATSATWSMRSKQGRADDARRLARGHVQRFNGYMQRRAQEEPTGSNRVLPAQDHRAERRCRRGNDDAHANPQTSHFDDS
ncbi:MAG: hypothetical protein MZV70_08815 [Desulfobacterales bacterium]|nr:hypothetical protein [Desulfobacterales bacterium]